MRGALKTDRGRIPGAERKRILKLRFINGGVGDINEFLICAEEASHQRKRRGREEERERDEL